MQSVSESLNCVCTSPFTQVCVVSHSKHRRLEHWNMAACSDACNSMGEGQADPAVSQLQGAATCCWCLQSYHAACGDQLNHQIVKGDDSDIPEFLKDVLMGDHNPYDGCQTSIPEYFWKCLGSRTHPDTRTNASCSSRVIRSAMLCSHTRMLLSRRFSRLFHVEQSPCDERVGMASAHQIQFEPSLDERSTSCHIEYFHYRFPQVYVSNVRRVASDFQSCANVLTCLLCGLG